MYFAILYRNNILTSIVVIPIPVGYKKTPLQENASSITIRNIG